MMKKRGIKLNSIRTKLVVSMIALCLVPLIILGIGSYQQSKAKLDEKLRLTST